MEVINGEGFSIHLPEGKTAKQPKKKSLSTVDFGSYHDFPFVDSWDKQRSPSKADLLSQYEDIVYSCAGFNAEAVVSTRLRLFVKIGPGQSTRWDSNSVAKGKKAFLRGKSSLNLSRNEDVREIADPSHPLLMLLDKPNPQIDGCSLLEFSQLYQEIIGSAYWLVRNNALQVPQELWLLPSQYVQPILDSDGFIVGYDYRTQAGKQRFAPDEVIKFTLPNLVDPMGEGMSPLRAIWEPLNIANKVLAHEGALLDNSARPDAIASVKDGLGEKEAERWEFRLNNKFRRQGTGGIVVLEEDTNLTPIGFAPKDMAMLEMHRVSKTQICNAYRVPLSFLETEDVNRANMISSRELHAKNAIVPRLRRLERILNDRLTRLFDPSGRLFLAFDNPSPQDREFDLQERSATSSTVTTLVTGGIITPNEARIENGFDPLPGGDELRRMPGELFIDFGSDEDSTPEAPQAPENVPEPEAVATEQEIQTSPEMTLNGAQIQSALNIVQSVALGELPRDAGLGSLRVLLNLSDEQAETIMGSVGLSFQPPREDQNPQAEGRALILPEGIEEKSIPRGRAGKLPSGKELVPILVKHFEKQKRAILRSLKKQASNRTEKTALPTEFVPVDQWTEELADEVLPAIEIFFGEEGKALIQRVGASPDVFNVKNPHVAEIIKRIALEFAESTIVTTTLELNTALAKLREELAEGIFEQGEDIRRLTERVGKVFDHAEKFRSQRIAQSEASRAHHEGLRQAAKDSGVVKGFRLLLSSDPCEKCLRVFSETPEVGLDGSFSLGEGVFAEQLAPLHPNCLCSVEEIL